MLEDSKRDDGEGSEDDVEQEHVPVVVDRLTGESCVRLEVEERESESDVLVEEVADLRRTHVVRIR